METLTEWLRDKVEKSSQKEEQKAKYREWREKIRKLKDHSRSFNTWIIEDSGEKTYENRSEEIIKEGIQDNVS